MVGSSCSFLSSESQTTMAVLSVSSLPRHRTTFALSPSDHGIKLFGKTIPAPARPDNAAQPAEIQDGFHGEYDEDGFSPRGVHDELGPSCGSGSEDEDCLGCSINEGKEQSEVQGCAEKLQESSKNLSPTLMEGTGKALRRLHIPIPCPRCQSLDTKFCYFNNYNVNQPRHFCKNCQRYWTAGGTLRNVPVGAGKRKGKHPSAQQRHAFAMHSVVCRRDDPGEASSLLSFSLPENTTDVKPSLQSASQTTVCAGKDGSFPSGSVSSHTPLLGTVSSNGATTETEWVQAGRNSWMDFQSHARDSYAEYSSNTSVNTHSTECPELPLCSSPAPAPLLQKVSGSNAERSIVHQDQSSSTSPENSSNTPILPVLAVPWPFLYQMYWSQNPIRTPTHTFPICPSSGSTLMCQKSPLPGPVWTFPSTVAPFAASNTFAATTSLGKRPPKDSVEDSSVSSPKTPRIHANESAASSSSLTTPDLVEMRRKS